MEDSSPIERERAILQEDVVGEGGSTPVKSQFSTQGELGALRVKSASQSSMLEPMCKRKRLGRLRAH